MNDLNSIAVSFKPMTSGVVASAVTWLKGVFLFAMLGFGSAYAQGVIGKWQTVSDADQKPQSIMRIDEKGGVYSGTIEKLLRTYDTPPMCKDCPAPFTGQPIEGLTIMNGLKKDSDTEFSGGTILDPASGKTYRVKMTLKNQGETLDVRGFIGVSLFGRTQTWKRMAP